jgi:hypothetical protein
MAARSTPTPAAAVVSFLINGHGGQWRHPVGLLWPARWFNQQAAIGAAFDPIACRMATTTNTTTTTATTTTTGSTTRIWVHGPAGSKMQGPKKKSPLARWAQLGHINTPTFSSIASFSFSSRLRCSSHHLESSSFRPRCSCFAARRPLALGRIAHPVDLQLVDLLRPPNQRWMPLPWMAPKWRIPRVQSDSVLRPCGHPSSAPTWYLSGRGHSEPPGFTRPPGCPLLPQGVPSSFPAAPPPWLCGPRPTAALGFQPLPVFNAVSGDHITRHMFGLPRREPSPVYIHVDITHTVADVQLALRRMFANRGLTVQRPIPGDPSLPIRAMTNERQGLSIYLPSPPEESPPLQQGDVRGAAAHIRASSSAWARAAAATCFEETGRYDHGRRGR